MSAESYTSTAGKRSEVFWAFLKLGCTSFGGPIAHLGFFRQEFVEKRRWLNDDAYADLVALCQFLPGPASSQVGMALGWRRAGYLGALLAWLAFTGPSAMLMLAAAYGVARVGDVGHAGWANGLKVAAVAVVAQALLAMAKKLCPDALRATIAVLAAIALLLLPFAWMQLVVLAAGALIGWRFGVDKFKVAVDKPQDAPHRFAGAGWLVAFFALLLALPMAAGVWPSHWLKMADGFYRTGSLVFGGGHTVLPLLERATVGRGWLDHDTFLAGYGAAQALPGPLFAFAAYLGAVQTIEPNGVAGGLLALGAIYLPSFFLVFGGLPQWDRLRHSPAARSMLAGTNAAVVGLLGAAFYNPIWTSAIMGSQSFILALAGFAALSYWKLPPWLVVLVAAVLGQLFL